MRLARPLVLLCASGVSLGACGSSTEAGAVRGVPTRSSDGAFTTVTPPGFRALKLDAADGSSAPAYSVVTTVGRDDAPAAIVVTPLRDRGAAPQQLADRARVRVARIPGASAIAAVSTLSIDGAAAARFTYRVRPVGAPEVRPGVPAPEVAAESILVVHAGRAYSVVFSAPPSAFAPLRSGLDQVLRGWRWAG